MSAPQPATKAPTRGYPHDLQVLVAEACLRMEWIAAWPNALERHAALEDCGATFGPCLERAMCEADIARAALGRTASSEE